MPIEHKNFYANYLAQTYYFVDHSVRLLGLAMARSENKDFRNRCIKHIVEEKGHEMMCVNDLKFMGLKPTDFKELALTKAFYQTQYFKTDRNPISLLGYILALEILAAKILPDLNVKIKELYPQSMTFTKIHGEEDQDHIESGFKQLEMLNERDLELVLENFEFSLEIFMLMMSSINQESIGVTLSVKTCPQASL